MLEEEGEDLRPRQGMGGNSQESVGKEADERQKSGRSACGRRRPQCEQQGCFPHGGVEPMSLGTQAG